MSTSTTLVISFPRTRTAWLSELLHNPPQSFAVHEGMNHCGHKLGLFRDMAANCGSRWFVDCSSSWLVNPGNVDSLNPSRIVLIQPESIQAKFDAHRAALIEETGPLCRKVGDFLAEMQQAAIAGWDRLRTYSVHRLWMFNEADLDSFDGCKAIAEAASPGLEISQLRLEDLRLKRITQDIKAALAGASSRVDPFNPGV